MAATGEAKHQKRHQKRMEGLEARHEYERLMLHLRTKRYRVKDNLKQLLPFVKLDKHKNIIQSIIDAHPDSIINYTLQGCLYIDFNESYAKIYYKEEEKDQLSRIEFVIITYEKYDKPKPKSYTPPKPKPKPKPKPPPKQQTHKPRNLTETEKEQKRKELQKVMHNLLFDHSYDAQPENVIRDLEQLVVVEFSNDYFRKMWNQLKTKNLCKLERILPSGLHEDVPRELEIFCSHGPTTKLKYIIKYDDPKPEHYKFTIRNIVVRVVADDTDDKNVLPTEEDVKNAKATFRKYNDKLSETKKMDMNTVDNKRAYRRLYVKLGLHFHPDKTDDMDAFKDINNAYETMEKYFDCGQQCAK